MRHHSNWSETEEHNHIKWKGLLWMTQAKIRLSHLFPTHHEVINEFLNGSSLLSHLNNQALEVGIQRQSLTREPGGPCSIRDRVLALKPELCLKVPPGEWFSHLVLLGLSFLTCKWGNFSWLMWRSKVITTTNCCVYSKNSINHVCHLVLLQNRDRDSFLFISTLPVFDYHSFYSAIPSSPSFLGTW